MLYTGAGSTGQTPSLKRTKLGLKSGIDERDYIDELEFEAD